MTDNEIIKALENVSEWFTKHGRNTNTAVIGICKKAIGLIKRQQAEIERLSKPQGVTFLANGIEIHAKGSDEYYKFKRFVKSEAITEFAERLIEETRTFSEYDEGGWECDVSAISAEDIDRIAKEMVEGNNGT